MKVLHYPRLDTILMVENTLKSLDFHPSKMILWDKLPKKVQYQTFKIIIEYLRDSNKLIIYNKKIIWTFNPQLIENSVEIEV